MKTYSLRSETTAIFKIGFLISLCLLGGGCYSPVVSI